MWRKECMKILFASKNKNKFKEIKEIFKDSKFEIIFDDDLEDVVEDKDTILGNAQKKSEEIFLKDNIPVLSDDSGLFVEALGNLPGVSTARYAGENASDQENIEKMLKNLSNEENRKAFFKTVIYFFDGETRLDTEGILNGQITTTPRGTNGFGYDPIFEIDGSTLAELSFEEKTDISHRKIAAKKMFDLLTDTFSE